MPTTLPARRPLSAEHQAISADLAAMSATVAGTRRSGDLGLLLFFRLRFGLWRIRRRLRRLKERRRDER